jgi:HEPN domain-containing protein
MSVESLIASYLRLASNDMEDAKLVHTRRSRNAIYHCEQAAEKVIKAVLTSEGLLGSQEQTSHQLRALVDKIPDENTVKIRLREVEGLYRFATGYRYPNMYDKTNKAPEDSEFEDYMRKVEALLVVVVAHFGVDLSNKNSPATNTKPIR